MSRLYQVSRTWHYTEACDSTSPGIMGMTEELSLMLKGCSSQSQWTTQSREGQPCAPDSGLTSGPQLSLRCPTLLTGSSATSSYTGFLLSPLRISRSYHLFSLSLFFFHYPRHITLFLPVVSPPASSLVQNLLVHEPLGISIP